MFVILISLKSVSRAVTRDDEEEQPVMNICGPTDFQHEGHMGFSEKGIEVCCFFFDYFFFVLLFIVYVSF